MFFDCIMAGFGGQGILSAGMILSYTAVAQDLNVTWFPAYGAEQRGGTANCAVVISDEVIGSPIISNPTFGYIMNKPSLDKFQPKFKSGAKVVVDSSLIFKEHIERDDIDVLGLDATLIATEMGNVKVANVIMIGSLLKVSGIFDLETAKVGLKMAIPERHHKLLPLNYEALQAGFDQITPL